MLSKETEIINKLGLHARASAKLTQLAGKYKSEVWMAKGPRRINAKSIPTIPGIKPQRVPADYVARMMNQRQTNG